MKKDEIYTPLLLRQWATFKLEMSNSLERDCKITDLFLF